MVDVTREDVAALRDELDRIERDVSKYRFAPVAPVALLPLVVLVGAGYQFLSYDTRFLIGLLLFTSILFVALAGLVWAMVEELFGGR